MKGPLVRYFVEMALAFSLWLPLAFLVLEDPDFTISGVLAFEGVVLLVAFGLALVRAGVQASGSRGARLGIRDDGASSTGDGA